MRNVLKSGVAALMLALLGMLGSAQLQAAGDYRLATASTGGTYYPVGVALSTLVKVKLQPEQNINMTAISSAGSAENIQLLHMNEVQFALLQGLYGAFAWHGSGPLEKGGPQTGLRSVTMLWQNVEHFLVTSDHVKTGTISDALAIRGVAGFGKKNSGSLGSSRTILANLGVDVDEQFDIVYGGYEVLTAAMQDDKADLVGTPAGIPVSTVTKLLATSGDAVRLLSFDARQAARADGGLKLWTPYVIPAGTYPGQQTAINTIAQPNFLAVRADVPEDDVYLITKTIYNNLSFLKSTHKATEAMALKKALFGLPMPLHPGAARYFREVGLEIPARMITE